MRQRYERANGINQKPSEKDLTYEEYYAWLESAEKAVEECRDGKITLEEALEIINVP